MRLKTNIRKKFTSVVVLFIALFIGIGGISAYYKCDYTAPENLSATEGGTLNDEGIFFTQKKIKGYSVSKCNFTSGTTSSSWLYAYCYTGLTRGAPYGTITKDAKLDAGYTYIIKHGYPNTKKFCDGSVTMQSAASAEKATQFAMWLYRVDVDGASKSTVFYGTYNYDAVKNSDSKIRKAAKCLLNEAKEAKSNGYPKSSTKLKVSSTELEEDGDYYYSDPITVSESTSGLTAKTYEVSVTSTPEISGIKIVDTNGKALSGNISVGKKFRVRIPASSIRSLGAGDTLNVKTTVSLASNYYAAYRYTKQSYQEIVPAVLTPVSTSSKASKTFTLAKPEDRKVTIKKVDSVTGSVVAGAKIKLTLTKDSNEFTEEFITTDSAKSFKTVGGEEITEGSTIKVEEICAPSEISDSCYTASEVSSHNSTNDNQGYSTKAAAITKTIGSSNITITMKNVPDTYCLTLNKVDNYGNRLLGSQFSLVGHDISKTIDLTSNASATITGLYAGTYTLTETLVPSGFEQASDQTFTIGADNASSTTCLEKTITNTTKSFGVYVLKTDAFTGKPLAGAEMQVIDSATGDIIDSWVTTTKAHTVIDKRRSDGILTQGTYTVKEVKAPSSDYILGKDQTFTINGNDSTEQVINITVSNERVPTVYRFAKKDSTTKEYVAGAILTIYDESGKPVTKLTTQDKPVTLEQQLPVGKYKVEETFAPTGYVKMDSDPIEFEVTKDAADYEIAIENIRERTKHYISKKDITNGEEVEGATLIIKNSKGEEVRKWVSTDEPKLIDDLPIGVYTIEETIAPKGYVLSSDKLTFEVKADGVTRNDNVMYNTPKVEVPDTASSMPIAMYFIGFTILTSGAGTVYFNAKKRN